MHPQVRQPRALIVPFTCIVTRGVRSPQAELLLEVNHANPVVHPAMELGRALEAVRNAREAGVTSFVVGGHAPLHWRALRTFLVWFYCEPAAGHLTLFTAGQASDEAWATLFADLVPRGLDIQPGRPDPAEVPLQGMIEPTRMP